MVLVLTVKSYFMILIISYTGWTVIVLIQNSLDIAYTVSIVSQFMQAPRIRHLNDVYRILKHLKKSPGQGILYSKTWSFSCGRLYWSRLGSYCTMTGGSLMSWKSKKQPRCLSSILKLSVEHCAWKLRIVMVADFATWVGLYI